MLGPCGWAVRQPPEGPPRSSRQHRRGTEGEAQDLEQGAVRQSTGTGGHRRGAHAKHGLDDEDDILTYHVVCLHEWMCKVHPQPQLGLVHAVHLCSADGHHDVIKVGKTTLMASSTAGQACSALRHCMERYQCFQHKTTEATLAVQGLVDVWCVLPHDVSTHAEMLFHAWCEVARYKDTSWMRPHGATVVDVPRYGREGSTVSQEFFDWSPTMSIFQCYDNVALRCPAAVYHTQHHALDDWRVRVWNKLSLDFGADVRHFCMFFPSSNGKLWCSPVAPDEGRKKPRWTAATWCARAVNYPMHFIDLRKLPAGARACLEEKLRSCPRTVPDPKGKGQAKTMAKAKPVAEKPKGKARAKTTAKVLLQALLPQLFTLAGNDLADCIRKSPGCTRMFCEYAKEFVNAMQKANGEMPHEDQVKLSDRCCKQNSVYQILYPDPTTMLENIDILKEDVEEDEEEVIAGVESADSSGSRSKETTLPEEKFPTESSMWPMRGHDMCHQMSMGLSTFVQAVVRPAASAAAVEADAMALKLQAVIPELNAQKGSHVVLKQPLERDRAESSCISVLALAAGKYDIFTKPQAPAAKLRAEQWYQLRDIIRWIRPTEEQLHAVMVLLAIRALGKSKAIVNQLPKSQRRPERAVLYLMEFHENVVPSSTRLDEDGLRRVRKALEVHETFNLAQMLQGENIPANVNQLQELIRGYAEEGMEVATNKFIAGVFRFYILFLLGFMSGLASGHGNATNAPAVISGIGMLQHLMDATARGIYWGFAAARDFVLVRLACLSRVQDAHGYKELRRAWDSLGAREQSFLVQHFLSDGLEERALVLEFLPACVANAKTNSLVGLTILLEVLVDLLSNLWMAVESMPNLKGVQMIPVDLSDMGEFIAAVQNRFVFQTCVSRCKFHFVDERVRVEMTGGNWGRTNDPDTDMTSLAYIVKVRLAANCCRSVLGAFSDVLMKQQVMASSDPDLEDFAATEDDRLDWPGKASEAAVRRVEELQPLSRQVLPRHGSFLSLLQGPMELDPQHRMDAVTGCKSPFFLEEAVPSVRCMLAHMLLSAFVVQVVE
ncbi:unnamed protein product [Symbiodinium necroappetens]|uniref:Uncharacterized protein n=1 Tax=Symbiodinium necroappetens TaxID=1628268 RepID=A0A812ZWR6_9DINO|nr:unnamed protein product [Symbiodinium necroappetens]